jgi:TonB family protein
MQRYIIISLAGHILVFAGLIFGPMLTARAIPPVQTIRVTVVTPQSISPLLAKNAEIPEVKPKVPQVQESKEKLIPKPETSTRKAPPVKRSSPDQAETAAPETKSAAGAKGPSAPEGMKPDQAVDNEYLVIIAGIIKGNWKFPNLNNPNIQAVVFFEIGTDGKITLIRVEKPSGNRAFDSSVYEAVQKSNPFPSLPYTFTGNKLGIHLTFSY